MATFCGKCGTQRGFHMSSIRTSKAPCDYCGGFDKIEVRRRDGVVEKSMNNYSYPTNLLATTVESESEGA